MEHNKDAFLPVMAGTALLGVAAVILSFLVNTPLSAQFTLNANDFFIGVIATLPLVVFLWWFSNTSIPYLVEFRNSQIKFFAKLDFEFTPARIALMALGAGLSEELLFRGVFQSGLEKFLPVIAAILLSNIVFGLLHMRTALYAFIAGGVGVYFGVLYAMTGNLLVPIVAHTLYDAVALDYTRRAIADLKPQG